MGFALTATGAEEALVPASDHRALQNQGRELQRLLAKKTLEAGILKEALVVAAGPKKGLLRSVLSPRKRRRGLFRSEALALALQQ